MKNRNIKKFLLLLLIFFPIDFSLLEELNTEENSKDSDFDFYITVGTITIMVISAAILFYYGNPELFDPDSFVSEIEFKQPYRKPGDFEPPLCPRYEILHTEITKHTKYI